LRLAPKLRLKRHLPLFLPNIDLMGIDHVGCLLFGFVIVGSPS
jgi:hypothetical protein